MLTCLLTVESTFVFDDKRKLYVSLNFLMYVSPVFKAMFTHDFQERKTREVPLPGKEYEGFLEFLLCLHPNRQKPVDGCTVFLMLELAEEYQSSPIIQKCKAVMINWLQSVPEKPTKLKTYYSYAVEQDKEILSYISYCRACIMILGTAIRFQYEELVSTAVNCIARFGFQIFSGIPRPVCGNKNQELIDTELKKCKNMYDQLPEPVKQRLLTARLQHCDNWT